MSDKKKIDRTLGDKIYDLRTSGNYSQEYVGRLAGVTRQTVSKWEANYSQPKYENLKQLCNALDVDISYMTSNEDIKAEENNKEPLTESEVLCDEVANSETQEVKFDRVEDVHVQEKPNKPNNKRNLSKKSKTIIASVVIAIVLIVGVAMIIFDYLIATPMKEGAFGGESMVEHNFSSVENIGWILFGVSFAVAVIMGIILLVNKIRYKNE